MDGAQTPENFDAIARVDGDGRSELTIE